MSSGSTPNPTRSDAALVYRHLRDVGPGTAVDISLAVFPVVADGGPASTEKVLRKRSLTRFLDAVSWMRGEGVVISAVPQPEGRAVFHLGFVATTVVPSVPTAPTGPTASVGTDVAQVSQDDQVTDAMAIWGH